MTQQRRKERTSEARTRLPEKHEVEGVCIGRMRSAPNDVAGAIVVKYWCETRVSRKRVDESKKGTVE